MSLTPNQIANWPKPIDHGDGTASFAMPVDRFGFPDTVAMAQLDEAAMERIRELGRKRAAALEDKVFRAVLGLK